MRHIFRANIVILSWEYGRRSHYSGWSQRLIASVYHSWNQTRGWRLGRKQAQIWESLDRSNAVPRLLRPDAQRHTMAASCMDGAYSQETGHGALDYAPSAFQEPQQDLNRDGYENLQTKRMQPWMDQGQTLWISLLDKILKFILWRQWMAGMLPILVANHGTILQVPKPKSRQIWIEVVMIRSYRNKESKSWRLDLNIAQIFSTRFPVSFIGARGIRAVSRSWSGIPQSEHFLL